MHDLQVREVVTQVPAGPSRRRGLDGIERLPHGPVPDGVDMNLEPRPVEACDEICQGVGLDEAQAAIAGLVAGGIEIGTEQGCGERLADAVLHDLDRVRPEPVTGSGRARRFRRSTSASS